MFARLKQYPHLENLLKVIIDQEPRQKNSFQSLLEEAPEAQLSDSELFLNNFSHYLNQSGLTWGQVAESYISICKDTFREQVKFSRSGHYSLENFDEAAETIYSNPKVMHQYMIGLAVSQFLWTQHYQIFSFFKKIFDHNSIEGNYLEIGPGHGLYFLEAMKRSKKAQFHAVDLSETSIEITKGIIQALSANEGNVHYHLADIFEWSPQQSFDVIVMGEVLEHVERPNLLLKRAQTFLAKKGLMFVTTCANCPAIDHVYLFKNAAEIRTMIDDANLQILEELALERDYGMRGRGNKKILTTQYAALVKRKA